MKRSKARTITKKLLILSIALFVLGNLHATNIEKLIVVKNNKVIFDLFGENLTPIKIIKTGILKNPKFGKIKFNSDESITYIPNKNVCEEIDEFSYFIKTKKDIDTLKISVEILCEALTIMNGFSPDGDGQNDTFTILGVQNYPDNSLLIFNKWGEQVFEQTNYKNDWNGGKTEGENLSSEDSVYYYVFKDGKGKSYSGYLQILAQN
ncbi:MAG: gliding motility-associated C-terminal domain-containing protein [Bacteroidetes bacterium]|jgi:gliding motility-associated-like protein|nr:gliding motility-associated C-terminal domain-containing protein [Bacteroidota bacterium]